MDDSDNDSSMEIDVGVDEPYKEYVPPKVVTDSLRKHKVLRSIFKYVSTSDLRKLSHVSKKWSYEARRQTRKRGRTVKGGLRNCDALRDFATDLQHMNVVPISGMIIYLKRGCRCVKRASPESLPGELDPVYSRTLDRVQWKLLSLDFDDFWDNRKQCQAFLLVKKILEEFSSVLTELTLKLPFKRDNFMGIFPQDCKFSNLKTLRFVDTESTMDQDYTESIKALVSMAPNLRTLYTRGEVNLGGNLLEGSSAVHVTSHPYLTSTYMQVTADVAGALGVPRMKLTLSERDFNLGKFNEITKNLLINSCTTLTSIKIDPMFLVPLRIYGFCLVNVTKFGLVLDPRTVKMMQSDVKNFITSFDFSRLLPKVESVAVKFSEDKSVITKEFNGMVKQRAVIEKPGTKRAGNIWNLEVDWSSWMALDEKSVGFLGQLFPDIRQLIIRSAKEVAFRCIWEFWLSLDSIIVSLSESVVDGTPNFDSVFCGIYPAEVEELRKCDDWYLERVQIVPVQPSMSCLKNLKYFHLTYDGTNYWSDEACHDPTYLFSEVAAHIAFSKGKERKDVFLTVNDKRDVRHLKPYAYVSEPEYDHSSWNPCID